MPCYPPPGTDHFTIHVLSQDFSGRRVWEHALWNAHRNTWTRWMGERPTPEHAQNCNATYRWQLTSVEMLALIDFLGKRQHGSGGGSASAGSGGGGASSGGYGFQP